MHALQSPPEAGIEARPPDDSVVYASWLGGRVGGTLLGWIRSYNEGGMLTFEEVR